MELSNITENAVIQGNDGGKSAVNLNYILFIIGFFTGITALIAVILAYVNREAATEPYRSHLNWQIKIFWRGVIFAVVNTFLYIVVSMIAVATMGLGAVLLLLPLASVVWWLVWTIKAIAKGMKALGQHQAITK